MRWLAGITDTVDMSLRKPKEIVMDKEGLYIMIKGSILQEVITTLSVY